MYVLNLLNSVIGCGAWRPGHRCAALVAEWHARLRQSDERALQGEVLVAKLRAFIAQQLAPAAAGGAVAGL